MTEFPIERRNLLRTIGASAVGADGSARESSVVVAHPGVVVLQYLDTS